MNVGKAWGTRFPACFALAWVHWTNTVLPHLHTLSDQKAPFQDFQKAINFATPRYHQNMSAQRTLRRFWNFCLASLLQGSQACLTRTSCSTLIGMGWAFMYFGIKQLEWRSGWHSRRYWIPSVALYSRNAVRRVPPAPSLPPIDLSHLGTLSLLTWKWTPYRLVSTIPFRSNRQ